jgi:hypothetical protein
VPVRGKAVLRRITSVPALQASLVGAIGCVVYREKRSGCRSWLAVAAYVEGWKHIHCGRKAVIQPSVEEEAKAVVVAVTANNAIDGGPVRFALRAPHGARHRGR